MSEFRSKLNMELHYFIVCIQPMCQIEANLEQSGFQGQN